MQSFSFLPFFATLLFLKAHSFSFSFFLSIKLFFLRLYYRSIFDITSTFSKTKPLSLLGSLTFISLTLRPSVSNSFILLADDCYGEAPISYLETLSAIKESPDLSVRHYSCAFNGFSNPFN